MQKLSVGAVSRISATHQSTQLIHLTPPLPRTVNPLIPLIPHKCKQFDVN